MKPLVHIMGFLAPYPERMCSASVCRTWRTGANDGSFIRHVLPVEMGVLALDSDKMDQNHFRTISEALENALPGDTIELGDGHYWANEGLNIHVPLRFIGDENDPTHVVIELSGTVNFDGVKGWMEGITLRRPRIATDENQCESLRVLNGGSLNMVQCILDNEGRQGNVALLKNSSKGQWKGIEVRGGGQKGCGIAVEDKSHLNLVKCLIHNNQGDGVQIKNSSIVKLKDSKIKENIGIGLSLCNLSRCEISGSCFVANSSGETQKDDTSTIERFSN
eukprot:CAMPEP_0183324824 /NCGR_PEP_ID=MMETSP0160_2-20130417/78050_1 /TAXON_ID=2839 ORGANISM="Odontella Sinensis, Strain Grunow 1884" /NCGR_SAMPLE_ID=MMETSP0160_2 /ASSEMBLY_ACC=CAM_ASM_000250 /LENGTH=276 /DNA_ID=CAMNT_0025492495 /DNA_START=18 /DNA_END=851 /DNA_ORIENTATION=+